MPTIDNETLMSLKDLLGDRFTVLIQTYIDDGDRRLSLLRDGVANQDFEVVRQESHGLKGSSRNIGAIGVGECCDKLEVMGRGQVADGLEQIFATVEQDFAATCHLLKEYLQSCKNE